MGNKNEDINDIAKKIEDLGKQMDNLGSVFDNFDPMDNKYSNINNMEKAINQLKDILPIKPEEDDIDTTAPPVDGETCLHGNSWHSNCSDCDNLDDIEVVVNEIENLIKTEPNDKELGKKVRNFYNNWIEYNEDNSDTTNNIDI